MGVAGLGPFGQCQWDFLQCIQHPLFVHFCHFLQADYDPPSRERLATTLLDETHLEIKQLVEEKLKTVILCSNEIWDLYFFCFFGQKF